MSLFVSVVVCAYTLERWADIAAGVRAVAAQRPGEILLVIDHNDDLLGRARTELAAGVPRLRVVASTGRRGLSGARNTGVTLARGELVVFLDDDARPEAAWLERLVAPFAEPDVQAVGGRSVPAWPVARPAWFPPEFDWVVGSSYRGLPERRSDVRNVIGASMAIRRTAFAAAGLFAEDVGRVGTLPVGCEETELCIRIRQRVPGARVVYAPDSLVRHRVSAERTRPRYFARRCLAEGSSKAQITALVGADATSTERSYVARTLPAGVVRGLRDAGREFSRSASVAKLAPPPSTRACRRRC